MAGPAPVDVRAGGRNVTRMLTVARSAEVAPGVRALSFVDPDGAALPSHPAGAHLVLDTGPVRNAYSLLGDGLEPAAYEICVLLRPDGRGGSAYVHGLRAGDRVTATGPRSAFAPVATARHHMLVAGGIGITPLLSHARAARRWNRSHRLFYVHRPGAGLDIDAGADVFTTRGPFLAAVTAELADQPLGTHLYVCGPGGLIDAVIDTARRLGWPDERLHVERFAAEELDPGEEFTVHLRRSGRTVAVPSGVSLLEALEGAGVAVPNLCRQGVCGECRVGVLAGTPLHRDLFLDTEERTAGTAVMCCTSRSNGPSLELDL
jgi:ferredoxin-NADP reductase